MKNNFIVSILFIIVLLTFCGCSSEEKAVFEQIGYAKFELGSGVSSRSFVFYTSETDTDKILEHAKKQQNTPGGFTYVHYYNDKEKAPDNTLFPEETAYDLKDYTDGQILVYEKMASGKVVVWDGEMNECQELTE